MPKADDVVQSLSDMFAFAAARKPPSRRLDGYAEPRKIIGFSLQTWDDSRPRYRSFVHHAELESWVEATARHPLYGGILDNPGEWISDLWESIRGTAALIGEITVNFVRGVATIAIKFGQALYTFVTDILPGAFDQAAQVAEAISRHRNSPC